MMKKQKSQKAERNKKLKGGEEMKQVNKNILFMLFLAFALLFGFTQAAMAAGTAADTNILNRALVDYKVNAIDQPDIPSSPTGCDNPTCGDDTDFEVDRKLDLLIDEFSNGRSIVTPSDTADVMSGTECLGFDVKNEGNSTIDVNLSLNQTGVSDPHNGTESETIADLGDCEIRLESDGTGASGTCQTSGTDTIVSTISNLAPDTIQRIWVTCDIDSDWVDGDITAVTLIGDFAEPGTGTEITVDDRLTADDPAAVDDVFADGLCLDTQTSPGGCQTGNDANYDGKHSDSDSFEVNSADLEVTKTSAVYSDPFSSSNPKAIPGAVITYTITVANTGDVDATDIEIDDSLAVEIASGTIAFNPTFDDGDDTCVGTKGIVVDNDTGSYVCQTNAAGGPDDLAEFTSDVVKAYGLTAGDSTGVVRLKYQVIIQ
jgi:uncharacterized repeat protein (TIGR01451 family)